MLFFLAVFGAGAAAGFLNVLAGGGSLITLPILLLLGLPAADANGTNRVAIFVQNIAAVASFRQAGRRSDLKTGAKLAVFTLPGAAVGAFLAIYISEAVFRTILAVVLVLAVAGLLRPVAPRGPMSQSGTRVGVLSALALVGIGFYGGFIQAGVGFLFMLVLYRGLGFDLVTVNVHKVFIVLLYTIPAFLVFLISGKVNWTVGLVLAGGNAVGAVVGTRVSLRGGERVIRIVVAVALVLMAVQLIVGLR